MKTNETKSSESNLNKYWIGVCKRDAKRITAQPRKLIRARNYQEATLKALELFSPLPEGKAVWAKLF